MWLGHSLESPVSTLVVRAGTLQEFLWQGPSTDVTQLEVLPLPCNSSMMPSPLCFGPAPSSLPLASTVIALPFQHRQAQSSEQVLHPTSQLCRMPLILRLALLRVVLSARNLISVLSLLGTAAESAKEKQVHIY